MAQLVQDYNDDDVIAFLKEEFERIITQYPQQQEGSVLSDAQAFEIWFLHQEMGIEYSEAAKKILDRANDCGVDFIWIDDRNRQVVVGQAEYEPSWSGSKASLTKAAETFRLFTDYLSTSKLPDQLDTQAKEMWRLAKTKSGSFDIRYVYITPKRLTDNQEEKIRTTSGIGNYDFITHDFLIERGREFLDGQTGMCNFDVKFDKIMDVRSSSWTAYIAEVRVKTMYELVKMHKEQKKLRALFASNVRTYLNTKKRNRDIAEAMKATLKNSPGEFFLCNNGITMICNKTILGTGTISLERGSITNGCQTVMNIHSFFEENPYGDPDAKVLVTIIEIPKEITKLAGDIATARNNQNPVDYRDLLSNNFRLVCLHHRLLADRVGNSERRYYLLRKAGEKQTLLAEEPESRGRYVWIDAGDLAQCIAAVIRQNPYVAVRGVSEIFGKFFQQIFPNVDDPAHSRCKYSWWLSEIVWDSFTGTDKWREIKDEQIFSQKDFKNPAHWIAMALIDKKLRDDFNFNGTFEQRFVAKAEKWWLKPKLSESVDFEELAFEVCDDAFRLVHSVSRSLLGKKLPKATDTYTTYTDLLKSPVAYGAIVSEIKKDKMITYQNRLYNSMSKLIEYLEMK